MNKQQIIIVEQYNEGSIAQLMFKEIKGQKEIIILQTDAIIGKNGITNNKKEGDIKTPIGTYKLGKIFGIKENPGTSLNYIQINQNHYWVDDSNSKYYNKMVNIKEVEKDWNSSEHLIEYPKQYEYAIEIKYNDQCKKGKGSAIFLHCLGDKDYTAGCVAVERDILIKIIKLLQKNARIKIQ